MPYSGDTSSMLTLGETSMIVTNGSAAFTGTIFVGPPGTQNNKFFVSTTAIIPSTMA